MTRRIVYGIGLWLSLAATAMTIASIVLPRWISWDSASRTGQKIHYSYGLHRRCSSLTDACDDFPQYEDCHGSNRAFCSLWRSMAFLMSFAVIVECATLIAYAVVILGGKQKRDQGWKIVCTLLTVSGLVQCAVMAIVVYLYEHDDRFFTGWRLDASWILCTVSWSISVLTAAGILAAAVYLPEEDGYELILEDTERRRRDRRAMNR